MLPLAIIIDRDIFETCCLHFSPNYEGVLQADAYAGFNALYEDGTIKEAACWAHARRKFYDLHAMV